METKINQEKCKHKDWSFVTNDSGNRLGAAICKHCNLWMTHSDALQYQNLRYQKTFQTWFNIVTIIISVIALIISIIVGLKK
jgi:hypothetical protein